MQKTLIIIVVLAVIATLLIIFLPEKTLAPDLDSGEITREDTTTSNSEDASDNESQQTVTPEPVSETPSVATVTYLDKSINPEETTVRKGQTIRFVNDSNHDMWIASSIHPTHQDYPEKSNDNCLGSDFDQCQSVGNGEFWDFTFNTSGTFNYHNHLRPANNGTVVVEE